MKPEIKAELIAVGAVDVDKSLLGRITVPTAGPGAGNTSFFFSSGGHRVRLAVNEASHLRAVMEGNDLIILKDGKEFARGILEKELVHCPGQAYITLSEKCVYDCKYCPVPKLDGKVKSLEEVLELIENANATGKMTAISITSGIAETAEKEVDRAVEVVREVKKYDVPIGVSVYPTLDSSRRLKDAGAVEVKYNVEIMDREIYKRLCIGQDLDFILESLRGAVDIFGRNRVYSNIIIGLGESDETVENAIEELTAMGVIPILRAASMHPLRVGEVDIERPTRDRILKLTRVLRRILDKNGLRADVSQTMCLPCMGCDMNPHIDLD